jgi:anti-sigma B factor antagonist
VHKEFDHAVAASASSMELNASRLTIEEHEIGVVTVLKLIGEILLDDGDLLFRAHVHNLMDKDRTKLVVDFGDVIHVDSSAVGMLVGKQQMLRKIGGDIRLLHLSPRYLRLLTTMRVLPLFHVFDDEATAVASFSDMRSPD